MPAPIGHRPDMESAFPRTAPYAAVVACGHVLRSPAERHLAAGVPCHQALGPWGQPDAGLPWLRIGDADGAREEPQHALAGGGTQSLADVLRHREWLILLVGGDHDSLALALAIAAYARGRHLVVTAIVAHGPPLPDFLRRSLLRRVHYACECPPGVDPLLAAQALWSSVAHGDGRPGTGFHDLVERLRGRGHLAWRPLPPAGEGRLATQLAALPQLPAGRCLWAVLLHPLPLDRDELRLAGDMLQARCPQPASLIQVATPPPVPQGVFVFTA